MLLVISPAKSLDYETPAPEAQPTLPRFIPHSAELVDILRKMSPAELGSLMSISDNLAMLNAGRFASWTETFTTENARPAVYAFNGDVYEGLDARSLTGKQMDYVRSHLRILSGLYGVLRPLDLMQPYRLEMGTRLNNPRGKDLYAFWGTIVTEALNAELAAHKSTALINLASEEYFKSVRPKMLDVPVITPVFEDWKGGRYKIISFHAKRARGSMARYAARHGIVRPEKLKAFDSDGYAYDEAASSEHSWVFRRRIEA